MFTIKYPGFYNQPQSNSGGKLGTSLRAPKLADFILYIQDKLYQKTHFAKWHTKNYNLAYHYILIHTLTIKMF